ncbi:MAG: aromatic ring-hydroxylating dioxygenase subunit alpha [Pseudomonadota bacterium]
MQFLRNTWYAAVWSEGIGEGQLVDRTILGEPLLFFRTPGGGISAIRDLCPHKLVPLHLGKLLPNGRVQCGYHGLEFDGTGACVRNPHGSERIPSACKVPAYPVVEKHSMVWVWMGDAPADPATVPDYAFMDAGSGFEITKRDFIRVKANYRLLFDNLMDLSHSPFLHDGVIGGADTVKADIQVESSERTVKVHRPKFDVRPTGLLDRLYRNDGKNVDIWSTIAWTAPCYVLNDTGAYPPGGARAEGAGILGAHLITPETENTTLYHFSAARTGQVLDPQEDAAALRDWISDARHHAFAHQDEPMIESQRVVREKFPHLALKPVLLEIDAGPVRCNRILDGLIQQEQDR